MRHDDTSGNEVLGIPFITKPIWFEGYNDPVTQPDGGNMLRPAEFPG